MNKFVLMLAAVAVLGTSLSACAPITRSFSTGRESMPLDETGPWTNRTPTEKELLLARSDFSVELVRVTDARYPRSMEALSRDQVIYQYDPDTLLGGVSTQVPAILGKYLSYRPKQPKHYKVEIEIKKLRTDILTGTFWSGFWGRYHADLELRVIARHPDSTVAVQRIYTLQEEQERQDYDGRGPSKERDRARMYDLVESLIRKSAEDIGWDIRQRDARRWKAPAPQSIPTRLNQPPVDRASGTPNADTVPATLGPLPTGAQDEMAPVQDTYPTPLLEQKDVPATTSPTGIDATPTDMWIDGPVENNDAKPVDEGAIGPII